MRTLEFDLQSDPELWDAVAGVLDEHLERATNAQESLNAITNVLSVAAAGYKALVASFPQLAQPFDEETFVALARQMYRSAQHDGGES